MKRILGLCFGLLFAGSAVGAELTTSGLLGASGESGLTDGAVVSSQTVTFKPTSLGGAILIQAFDQADNKELLRHMVPVKSLSLNAVNTLLVLEQTPALNGTIPAAITDQRVLAYSHATNLRIEFMLVGKVDGVFGGATLAGLGDGTFVWTASTAVGSQTLNADNVTQSSKFFVTRANSSNPNAGHIPAAAGWQLPQSLIDYITQSAGLNSNVSKALCRAVCGNPSPATNCESWNDTASIQCQGICNCAHSTGSNTWGACVTGTPSCAA